METVKEIFASAIPSLPVEKLDAVVKQLADIGVESSADLNFVDVEKDLDGILRPIEARKVAHFLASYRQSFSNGSNLLSSSASMHDVSLSPASTSSGTSLSTVTTPLAPCTAAGMLTPVHGWAEIFDIPWTKMPDEFVAACQEGKRPAKVHLLTAIRTTAAEIKKIAHHPGKANLATIARAMVAKYPQALADLLPGIGMLGDGTTSVTNRLVRQFENLNRCPGNSLRRKLLLQPADESSGEAEICEGSRKRKTFSAVVKDAYGCVAWQPELGNETAETQEKKKEWLQAEYRKADTSRDRQQISQFMADTYPSQRFAINQKKLSVTEISVAWPFLVTPAGLINHFKILLGFELTARFQQHFTTKGRLVVEHAQRKGNQHAKTIAATLEARAKILKNDIPLTFGSFLLLCHLLKEDQQLIIMHEDVVSREVMQESGHMHPHIGCAGDDVFTGECYVVIDRHALDPCDFATAVAVLFASYYVFNVAYPDSSVNTMEFVQRALADINPLRGTKSSKKKPRNVPPAVLKLLSELVTLS